MANKRSVIPQGTGALASPASKALDVVTVMKRNALHLHEDGFVRVSEAELVASLEKALDKTAKAVQEQKGKYWDLAVEAYRGGHRLEARAHIIRYVKEDKILDHLKKTDLVGALGPRRDPAVKTVIKAPCCLPTRFFGEPVFYVADKKTMDAAIETRVRGVADKAREVDPVDSLIESTQTRLIAELAEAMPSVPIYSPTMHR